MRQIEAARIGALRLEHLRAFRDRGDAVVQLIEGIGGHDFGRHVLVNDLVHEAGVRPVLQETPDKIGQQIAVRTDGSVDAAAGAVFLHDDVMQGLAHAVQALELVSLRIVGHMQNGGDGMGVMGGELRVDAVGHAQEFTGIGDVAHIRRGLAGEDRETVDPLDLRALDLGVPIGALDQPRHDAAVVALRHFVKRVDHHARARAIGLHDHAETVPAGQRRLAHHRVDHLERECEAVGLLGVDVEAHSGGFRQECQRPKARHQIAHHGLFLRQLVTRVQGRELDRNAGVLADVVMGAGICNGRDRAGVAEVIALGIGLGPCGFAQHVVAIGEALLFHSAGAFHRGLNVLTQHELAAHLAHGAADGGADHRLAQTFDRRPQVAHRAGLVVVEHAARQHQRPCRRVDEAGGRMPHVTAPIGGRDLVFDQRVDGLGIRHAQQRFGQTHERHAFLGAEPVFGKEDFHHAGGRGAADVTHQTRRIGGDLGAVLGRKIGLRLELGEQRVRLGIGARVDGLAKGGGVIEGHGKLQLMFRPEYRMLRRLIDLICIVLWSL